MNKKLSWNIVELVSDDIEHAPPAEERRQFERHLTSCPGCVTSSAFRDPLVEASVQGAVGAGHDDASEVLPRASWFEFDDRS